jgi:hypothetical protein
MSLTVMERKVVEQRAHTPAASLPSAPRQLELPAARKSDLPLSRFPGGFPGSPPRRWHAVRQQKALAHIGAAAPPDGPQRGRVQMVSADLRDREEEKLRMAATSALTFTIFS